MKTDATGTSGYISAQMTALTGYATIAYPDPQHHGVVRLYTMAPRSIDAAARECLPVAVSFIKTDPDSLLRDFIATSSEALDAIEQARLWRFRARFTMAMLAICSVMSTIAVWSLL